MKFVWCLCAAILAVFAPHAEAFVFGCSAIPSDENLQNSTFAYDVMMTMSPAKLYLRGASAEERYYSCIELVLYDTMQPPPAPVKRIFSFSFWPFGGGGDNSGDDEGDNAAADNEEDSDEGDSGCDFFLGFVWQFLGMCSGGQDAEDDEEIEPEYEYNFELKYYDANQASAGQMSVRGNFTILEDFPYGIELIGEIPNHMLRSDGFGTTLILSDFGVDWTILSECESSFLNFGYASYTYMFIAESFNYTDVDIRCMLKGLEDESGAGSMYPAGLC